MNKKHGFTLIELLATIATVAVLVALIFPTVGAIRKKADATKCLNNLRQIGAALNLYTGENDFAYPRQGNPAFSLNPSWWGAIAPYLGWKEPLVAGPEVARNTVGHCPGHTEKPGSFSYVGNMFMFVDPSQPAIRTMSVKNPSKKVVVWETHTWCWWPNTSLPSAGVGKAPFYPAYTHPAHGKATNHLFSDGHVEARPDDPMNAWHGYLVPEWEL